MLIVCSGTPRVLSYYTLEIRKHYLITSHGPKYLDNSQKGGHEIFIVLQFIS